MRRALVLIPGFVLLSLGLVPPAEGGVRMDKAHLPKKPFKIYDGHLSADQKRCLQYALKQWVDYDHAPLEGEGNRGSTGASITEAGGHHDLGDVGPNSRSQRSLGAGERGAMQKAYGDASPFAAGGDPTKPEGAGWFTSDEAAADLIIEPTGQVPGESGGTFGRCDFGTVEIPHPGTSVTTLEKGRLKDTGAIIWMRTEPSDDQTWCYPSDTDGDGFITNADAPCPAGTLDYYMIIKHELAHYFSFSHEGNQFEHVENPPPVYDPPASLCSRAMTPFDERGICESSGSEFAAHAGRAFFSSNRPGGLGGFDLWTLGWNDTLGSWGSPLNCGPTVNTAFDEIDPYSAVGEGVVFFSSNRPGGLGGYDLYFARRIAASAWDSVEALPPGINSTANETGPCELPDKLFFASDRPEGVGGFDLYAAPLSDSSNLAYGAAANMGTALNTTGNEIDPEVSTYEGDSLTVLYYSTDALASSYDLMRAEENMGTWATPSALGGTINTPADETDPSVGLGGDRLYFASNRDGGHGGWDIFASRNLAPRPFVLWDGDVKAPPNTEVRVEFDVVNRGAAQVSVQPQSFNTRGWLMQYSPQPFPLAPAARRTVPIRLQVPPFAAIGDVADVFLQVFAFGTIGTSAHGAVLPNVEHARVTVVSPVTVDVHDGLPRELSLRANPNPSSVETRLELGLPVAGIVRVDLFDLMGRRLRTLVNGRMVAGLHMLTWDGRGSDGTLASAGIVFARVTAGGRTERTTFVRVP
jgi:WD40-like Beta Propeller Repeat